MNWLVKSLWERDRYGNSVLTIEKSRGKITMEEIEEYLRYKEGGCHNGIYVIVINAQESTCGGNGCMDIKLEKDRISFYEYIPEETCPVCAKMAPPEFFPHCGEKIRGVGDA